MNTGFPPITSLIWKTIGGMVYAFEPGTARPKAKLAPLEPTSPDQASHHQVGAQKIHNEKTREIEVPGVSEEWLNKLQVQITGLDQNDFNRLEKDAINIAFGRDGNDTIKGGQKDDTIHGGDGHDYVRGGGGDDHVYGDEGNDRVTGAGGNDVLYGGNGHDFLFGGKGVDIMYGGSGSDVFYLKLANEVDMQDLETAIDSVDAIMDFEQGSDRIRLKSGAEVFYQHVTINEEIYTFIFNNDQGDGEAYGVIHDQHVDLSMRDFENAGKVVRLDPASFKSAADDIDIHFGEFDPGFLTLASVGVSEVM